MKVLCTTWSRKNGIKYPPKYVIAVANHLANGGEISTEDFHGTEARKFFESKGYKIEMKQEKYEITVTADSVVSTDIAKLSSTLATTITTLVFTFIRDTYSFIKHKTEKAEYIKNLVGDSLEVGLSALGAIAGRALLKIHPILGSLHGSFAFTSGLRFTKKCIRLTNCILEKAFLYVLVEEAFSFYIRFMREEQ
jgi:hypothetical protein